MTNQQAATLFILDQEADAIASGVGEALALDSRGDEGVARRLKALACTAPLHDLDARKSQLQWADATAYQMAEIGFQAIDQVTIAMDFDHGASHDQVVARLLSLVEAHAPGRVRGEYERVARWVIDGLINVGTVDRGFRTVYGVLGPEGYQRRHFDFKLLVELVSPDGEIYLRASDEAINVLVGALDTDVESAQIAAEVKPENLIKRGKLADAQVAAEQARYRTVQYAEILRRKLEATRRDVRTVDWLNEVPDLIREALEHIGRRYTQENAILANITEVRDEATEPDRKRRAAPRSSSTSCATASAGTPNCKRDCRMPGRRSGPSRTASSSPERPNGPRSTCLDSCSFPCCSSPWPTRSRRPTPVFMASPGSRSRQRRG